MRFRRPSSSARPQRKSHFIHRILTVLSVLAISVGLAASTAPAAQAATSGITIDVLYNGAVVTDDTVVPEGASLTLRVQYDAAQAIDGEEVTLTLPSTVTVPGSLPTNEALESFTQNQDGTITARFKNPIPADVAEGAFALNLLISQVSTDTEAPITWKIGTEEGGVKFIVEDHVVPPVPVSDSFSKTAAPGNLNGFVRTSGAPDFAFVGINPTILDQVLTYTLQIDSDQARTQNLTDTLPTGLTLDTASLLVSITQGEDTEFSSTVTASGNTIAGELTLPEQSKVTITYTAKVTDLAALEEDVRNAYDARGNKPGDYGTSYVNRATLGTETKTGTVTIGGNIPGVDVGNNFAKTSSWKLADVHTDANGTLLPAADMTYTFKADLTPWNAQNPNFTLQRNVVISDTLAAQASWNTGAGFISVTGAGPITALTEATGFTGTADGFKADAYIGQYAVVGQTLLINVGKNNTTNINIAAKAKLNTVVGLATTPTNVVDGKGYRWNNSAKFIYDTSAGTNRDANATVVALPDTTEGVNDSDAFDKRAANAEVRATPGQAAQVPYIFTIDTSKPNIDPLTATITDEVNTDVFDLSDLASMPLSGSYGTRALDRSHFNLALENGNVLTIRLSAAGKDLVGSLPEGERWIVHLELTTIVFAGKETFEIYNRATLVSEGKEFGYWSEARSEATSYGDEAELRKRIYNNETVTWSEQFDALIENGEFVNDVFVYSIELIPRGNYGEAFPVTIFTREDVLPAAVDFVGFIQLDDAGVPKLDTAHTSDVEMRGNVLASYANGVVTIKQKPGTNLAPNQGKIIVYFAVEANSAELPIVNTILGSSATIVPVGDPSIDIEKWSNEGATPEYDAAGALTNDGFEGDFDSAPGKQLKAHTAHELNFTVSNDGREDLVDINVSDALVDGSGAIENLVCTFPDNSTGTTWAGPFLIGTQFDCTGTLPALTPGDTHVNTASVTATGVKTQLPVDDEDAWNAYVPTASVTIEKWSNEGETPKYDASGVLLNDGFAGDFDKGAGKKLTAGTAQEIRFTVSNDGNEDLIDLTISDELAEGTAAITNLVCTFPDDTTGTAWAGPFAVGTQFECTGTLPALGAGQTHRDTAKVTATGAVSGVEIGDEDDWNAHTDAATLPNTGASLPLGVTLSALALLFAGGALLIARRGRLNRVEL